MKLPVITNDNKKSLNRKLTVQTFLKFTEFLSVNIGFLSVLRLKTKRLDVFVHIPGRISPIRP